MVERFRQYGKPFLSDFTHSNNGSPSGGTAPSNVIAITACNFAMPLSINPL